MNWQELMQKVVARYSELLGDNLVGIYLHGSCAFGCENGASDIDFIVVVKKEPTQEQKETIIKILLDLEADAPKKGFEMSVVLEHDCIDFTYPTPYCLHYSQMHRQRAVDDIALYCCCMNGFDHDLAAHFTVIKNVGIVLYGEKIENVFGKVRWKDYIDSICRDIEDTWEHLGEEPIYFILNLCRVWAACRDKAVLSKEQGGIWAKYKLSAEYLLLLDKLLSAYRMGEEVCLFEDEKLRLERLAELLMKNIEEEKNKL